MGFLLVKLKLSPRVTVLGQVAKKTTVETWLQGTQNEWEAAKSEKSASVPSTVWLTVKNFLANFFITLVNVIFKLILNDIIFHYQVKIRGLIPLRCRNWPLPQQSTILEKNIGQGQDPPSSAICIKLHNALLESKCQMQFFPVLWKTALLSLFGLY